MLGTLNTAQVDKLGGNGMCMSGEGRVKGDGVEGLDNICEVNKHRV